MASGYVVNVWLGRLLGPEDYGRFGVAISLLTILNVVQGAVRRQSHVPRRRIRLGRRTLGAGSSCSWGPR